MTANVGVGMSHAHVVDTENARKLLVERVAASRYINRSARLRDLLLYLSERVLEGDAGEIHEQEVGHRVFGRAADYDTTSDNIVRVHASMLRKRLEQYFAAEGSEETIVIEIPKGNYAPVFHERPEAPAAPAEEIASPVVAAPDRRVRVLAAITVALACSTAYLFVTRSTPPAAISTTATPVVRQFWQQVFRPGHATDVVLDDAAVALYQELSGRTLSSSEYSDRSYLRNLEATAAISHLDERVISVFKRRQSSFADANFLWKLMQMASSGQAQTVLRFARDYSFRELRSNNSVLLGNSRSNLWVEAFEPKMGLRWVYDAAGEFYYPVDTWNGGKSYHSDTGDTHEGYCSIALLPNLGGTGSVLIISGTGGSSINGGADFLADEQSIGEVRRRLAGSRDKAFPYFEVLIRVEGRSASPRNAAIVLCRAPKG